MSEEVTSFSAEEIIELLKALRLTTVALSRAGLAGADWRVQENEKILARYEPLFPSIRNP